MLQLLQLTLHTTIFLHLRLALMISFRSNFFLRSVISKDLNTKSDAESTVRAMMGLMIITIITGSESKIEAA